MAANRKRDIIEAATRSFALFGYKATTMDQVARLANVGKGTIYTFFRNKEELFEEILHTMIVEMKEKAEAVIEPDASFYANTHRALYATLLFRTQHQLAVKLFQEEKEIGTPAVTEAIRKVEESIIAYIAEKITAAITRGEIKQTDPTLAAFVMLKLYISLIADWERHGDPLPESAIAELFELYLFKGLST